MTSEEFVKIIVPAGSLGTGVRQEEVDRGIELGAHAIATDSGSTDSGAGYLAMGISKVNYAAVKRDLEILMKAQADAGISLLVGTCGQAGGDANVNWTRDIAIEVAAELGIQPRIAVLYSEQEASTLKAKNAQGKIKPLPPMDALADDTIDACDHIVGVMGPEPYIAALEAGADIVLGGRTTDPAVLAAFALKEGMHAGAAWHAAKIAECGAQCAVSMHKGAGVLISIGRESFEVEPLSLANQCTPFSVSAHMLYENSNPNQLFEPGGVLDVTEAKYEAIDDRIVRVTGSRWEPGPYTMKLEGAAAGRFQTLMLVGIREPEVLSRIDEFHDNLLAALYDRVHKTIGDDAGDFHISLRMYGWNAVIGVKPEPGTPPPQEVGMLFVATADTQEMATQIAKSCNPYFFHYPINLDMDLPSYGFAFSPAEIERGRVYEFKLNHVVEVDTPMELVRTEWVEALKPETV